MFNTSLLEVECPACKGAGKIENPSWANFWEQHLKLKDWFRKLDAEEQLTIAQKMLEKQSAEPMFFFCKRCQGKGKILTPEGKEIVDFLKFWIK